MDPLVSIICSTYQRANIIHLAIESALRQTYPHWELIICDDGSTDNTREVVKTYTDKRISYLNNGHQSYYTVNRNQGVKAAKGELMAFFDDDSVHHPEFLLEHVIRHEPPDVLLTYSGRATVLNDDPAKYTYDQIPGLPKQAVSFIQYSGETETFNGVVDVGDYVVKSNVMKALGGFSEEKDQVSYCSDMKLIDLILAKYPMGKLVMIPRRLHVNFMWGPHDHMTKRKLEAREQGKLGDEEQKWEWA